MGLMGKSKAFALNVVGNPVWQKVGEHFLTSVLKDYYVSLPELNPPTPHESDTTAIYLGQLALQAPRSLEQANETINIGWSRRATQHQQPPTQQYRCLQR